MSGPAQSVVLYGPPGCGKSTNAKRIAKALGLSRIVEFADIESDDRKQKALPDFGVLVIAQTPTDCDVATRFRHFWYDEAMRRVVDFELNGAA